MFSCKFISATKERNTLKKHVSAPYMRKTVEFEELPDSLSITVCGLGFYDIFVNGEKITKGLLAPYISNPDDVCYYDKYDLLPFIKKGKNVIGFILGNGFKNNDGGWIWDFDKAAFIGAPQVAFAIEGKIGDKNILIEADESVKVHSSPITFDDVRCGVFYDATKEIEDWNLPCYDDSNWGNAFFSDAPRGKARLCEVEPIVVRETHTAKVFRKGELEKGYAHHEKFDQFNYEVKDRIFSEEDYKGYIYDFGFNSSGVPMLTVYNTEAGQVIELQQCEYINHKGEAGYKNLLCYIDGYVQRDIYICKGGEKETFIPPFTYHGFRAVFVTGLKENQAKADTVKYLECSSDLKKRGNFYCSDEKLNKLQAMTRRSDLSNFYYFPTDCPQREKNGWTGDVMVSAEHMLLNLTCEKSLREYMFNVRAAQNEAGTIPGIVPTTGWGFAWGNGPIWDNVLIEVPYQVCRYTGDEGILRENAHAVMRYLTYASNKRNDKGLLCYGLGDWVKPKNENEVAPKEFVDSVMIYQFALKASRLFGKLNMKLEMAFADEFAVQLRKDIISCYINDENGKVANEAQTAYVLAIVHELFSEDGKKKAVENLVKEIDRMDGMQDCGMIGVRYLFYALSRNGYSDLAYELLVSDKATNYGNFIKRGLETLPESFTSFDENGDPLKWQSINHHFLGDISHFFISDIAGIRVNDNFTDAKNIDIAPTFITALDSAQGYFDSVCGRVEVKWTKNGKDAILIVTAPEGVYGEIRLPENAEFTDGQRAKQLLSGCYNIKL
ncbi:MAG: family 78 glycoside hydrolase catalytic domain [Acutalibacteraceae bacterium]|nr:family 78 glycoside hydrolase catalytic domain [Acutalibacteraceae bacterium]